MASPVILKGLAVSKDKAIPCVLLLSAPNVWDNGTPGVLIEDSHTLSSSERFSSAFSKRVPLLRNDGSARHGFMSYVRWLWQQSEISL
jgi:hypothetical protein